MFQGTKVAIKKIDRPRIELTRPLLLEFKRVSLTGPTTYVSIQIHRMHSVCPLSWDCHHFRAAGSSKTHLLW